GVVFFAAFALSTASSAQEYFQGYECTVDCSGHEAGYNWAAEHGITDPDDCGGNSQSFIEGCQAFAEENASGDVYSSDGDDEGGSDNNQSYQGEGDDGED